MTGKTINPAALAALLKGDLENARVAMTPGGIEAQEKAGQLSFVASEILPKECLSCTRGQLERMGIVFGDDADDLFVNVQLPDGWRKAATSHSMHSKLLDEKGRERASIFYKAAFYDRSAHISLTRRFTYRVEPVRGYDDPDYDKGEWHCVVYDGQEVAKSFDERVGPIPTGNSNGAKQLRLSWYDEKDALGKLGEAWLDKHYPRWKDPLSYWE